MTVRDFYQIVSESDKVSIKLDFKLVYRGKVRDIPIKYFDLVISHIGVSYQYFTFVISILS